MKRLLCTMALVGMLVAPGVVQAQLTAGPILAYHTAAAAIGAGAFLPIPVPTPAAGFPIVPNFVWFFPDGFDYFEVNGDVMYSFPVSADAPVAPFAFAGLNVARTSVSVGTFSASSTDIGLNLGGGINFNAGSVNPFAGAKFEIQDGTGFVIFGGLGFAVGGGA